MRSVFFLLVPLVALGCRSVAEPPAHSDPPGIRNIHPAPATSIVRFEEIDEGIYKGSKPKTDADYEFLQSKHVKYVVDLIFFPFLQESERRRAKAHGMTLITRTMNASPIQPSERHVNEVLCLLRDKRYQPIYIHCDLGRDRVALIVALYRMYYLGRSKEAAYQDMKRYGFKEDWSLRGLKAYFDQHSQPPIEQYVPSCPAAAPKSYAMDSTDVVPGP